MAAFIIVVLAIALGIALVPYLGTIVLAGVGAIVAGVLSFVLWRLIEPYEKPPVKQAETPESLSRRESPHSR